MDVFEVFFCLMSEKYVNGKVNVIEYNEVCINWMKVVLDMF